jgi:hypothetical protein
LVKEPTRGGADGAEVLRVDSWFTDVREVCKVFVKYSFSIFIHSLYFSLVKVSF